MHPELFRLKVSCYLSICRGGSGGRKLTVIVRRYRRRHAERCVYVKEKFFNKICENTRKYFITQVFGAALHPHYKNS